LGHHACHDHFHCPVWRQVVSPLRRVRGSRRSRNVLSSSKNHHLNTALAMLPLAMSQPPGFPVVKRLPPAVKNINHGRVRTDQSGGESLRSASIAASRRKARGPFKKRAQHALRFCSQIPRNDPCAKHHPRPLTLPFAFSVIEVATDLKTSLLVRGLCGCQCLGPDL